jgi:adenosylhomocysteinase
MNTTTGIKSDVANPALAAEGKKRIEWAARNMPVLSQIKDRFSKEKPFNGIRIAACMHVTTETANLMLALKSGGAEIALCASNPLSTQDETAAALVYEYGISVFAKNAVDRDGFYQHINSALDIKPQLVFDDGCDLVNVIHMFDNRYGTGQSTFDAIFRATNTLVAGKVVVVAGFGYCGKGVAERAKGLGAEVVVTEIDPTKALDALMQGFRVMPMTQAAAIGDIFITVTGNRDVLRDEHFKQMKDGAILANSGHFDIEIDVAWLEKNAKVKNSKMRHQTDEYVMADSRRILLIAEGRLANLGAAEGHPASVMDMSFSDQALTAEWLLKSGKDLPAGLHDVPSIIDKDVARLKLESMGAKLDVLTPAQELYLNSWEHGS